MLSLGQGQGGFAKELIKNGRRNGDWVCLQNCHLAVSWMPTLEKIQEDQVLEDTHPDYRLWLTSMPSNKFPVPVLQNSIKVTNEPPKGLKANLLRSYNDISDKSYDECTKDREFKLLLFSLAFFHAVILERRKYGAIGWNIPYEWMNSDFETSQLQLKMYLDEQPMVPYKTLNYLIAEINYGGRVTDDKDVRLITALLLSYLNEDVMKGEYKFSRSGIYHSPKDLDLSSVKEYISNLPLEDDPEIYGLHRNANITFQQKNAREFFETLLSIQPRTSGGDKSGETPDEIGDRMARDIESRMPELLPVKKIENPNSLDIFRMQEVDRFNKLIKVMKKSLSDLQKAIKGTTVMSIQLEKMFHAFLDKKVPELWEDVAYPSLKPLGSWVNDFIERVAFFRKWVENGKMDSYWVSALFFPQGFMTAAMQTYARRTHIAIDTLVFRA
jgi:dynein heavy chain